MYCAIYLLIKRTKKHLYDNPMSHLNYRKYWKKNEENNKNTNTNFIVSHIPMIRKQV